MPVLSRRVREGEEIFLPCLGRRMVFIRSEEIIDEGLAHTGGFLQAGPLRVVLQGEIQKFEAAFEGALHLAADIGHLLHEGKFCPSAFRKTSVLITHG